MDLFSDKKQELVPLSEIKVSEKAMIRVSTTIPPLDAALGGIFPDGTGKGGFVPGSTILFGGEPGVGKSTLLLQILDFMKKNGSRCVYDSAEESAVQLKMASERCLITSDFRIGNISVVEKLAEIVFQEKADILVIDSIQGFTSQNCDKRAGTPTQLSVSCDFLIKFAKDSTIPLVIICQLTGDGGFKGPKSLEHNVDVVGKLTHGKDPDNFRVLTFAKNRFGPTNIENRFPWLHEYGRYDFSPEGLATLQAVKKEVEKAPRKVGLHTQLNRRKGIEGPQLSEDVLVELAGLDFAGYAHKDARLLINILTMVRNQKETHFRVSEDHAPIFGLTVERMSQFLAQASLDPGISVESQDPWILIV